MILLSGTPALNRPAELFQQVNALVSAAPSRMRLSKACLLALDFPPVLRSFSQLPEFCTYRDFCARYSVAILNTFTRRLEEDGHQHEEELHLLLTNTVMIRRLKSQVLTQLPDKLRCERVLRQLLALRAPFPTLLLRRLGRASQVSRSSGGVR